MAHELNTERTLRANLRRATLVLVASLTMSGALAYDREPLERIVAVVNDDLVLLSELDREVVAIREQFAARKAQLPPERLLRRQVLERLIALKLQMQTADRIGIEISDDELNQTLGEIAGRNGLTLAEFPAEVAKRDVTWEVYRSSIRDEMLMERVRRQEVDRRVVVTPREVEAFLANDQQADDTEYLVSHILIALRGQATPEEVQKNEERAKATHEAITVKGSDFAQIATSYSDASDALEGGTLGWRRRAQLPSIFAERVAGMKPGAVSEPFRSGSGFHIMKLVEVRRGQAVVVTQTHARHILLRPNQVVSDTQARDLLVQWRKDILGGVDFEGLARLRSEDPGSKGDGGDLGWAAPGTFVPEFQAMLDKLAPNELSEPFKTTYGWHLVQLLERREQDVTDQARRNRAMGQIRQRKLEEQSQLWLQRLRDEAYIELKLES